MPNAQKTKYTITEAHRITRKARSTIQRRISDGTLTCEVGDDGVRLIDRSELLRVFPDECEFNRAEVQPNQTQATPVDISLLQHQLETARQQLATQQQERDREREHYRSQVDHLEESLRIAQEGQHRVTLLLEQQATSRDRTDTSWWKFRFRK